MRRLTEAQELLAIHVRELFPRQRIEFEYRFLSDRKWRFDVAIPEERIGFECNGHFQGKHGVGWSSDAEKMNHAAALGWRVFVFTNREVLRGNAKAWLQEWL